MSRARLLPALALLVVAACAEPPTTPSAVATRGPLARTSAASKHMVFFNSKAPADFADRVAALGGTVDASHDGVGIAVVSGLDAADAAALAGTSGISAVEMDQEFQFLTEVASPAVAAADVVAASPTNPAGAFFYSRQWNLRQVKANTAWAAGHLGSPAVRVAILDSGVDYLHADLAGRVDLSRSTSFVPSDDALVATFFPTRHPSTDLRYHGTHVAATVASNGIAAAGVTSMTTLMSVKVLNVNGSGSSTGILQGIVYAVDNGAHIINMSLGFQSPFPAADWRGFAHAMDRAFQYAQANGVAIVVAAGNEAYDVDTKHFFKLLCENKHVTCVSATGPTSGGNAGPWANPDNLAVYSNFGEKSISVAAPGGNVGAGVTAACSGTSLIVPVCQTGTFVVGISGTSMASPHVAGLAALILAQQGFMPPGALRSALEQHGVDDIGPKGKDAAYGRGRINVAKALGLE